MHICIFLDFCQSQQCLIKHVLILLVLSPARNWLPSIASFLSCDSHTPQIRPGRLMTASHRQLQQTILSTVNNHQNGPPQHPYLVPLLDVAKEKDLPLISRLVRRISIRLLQVRLFWNCLSQHSSVGLNSNINIAGSFRKITFRHQDWTMVNMSYQQFLLKYLHSSSRQSRRRANKRKRVRDSFLSLVSRHVFPVFFFGE